MPSRTHFVLFTLLACAQAIAAQGDADWCAERLRGPLDGADGRRYALAVSGGGYRAMLYHVGALAKLNDAGMLADVAVVSSVSGGSIAAGMLARAWPALEFEEREVAGARIRVARNFEAQVARPLFALAGTSIDVGAALASLFPGGSASDRIADDYDAVLFGGELLSDVEAKVSAGPIALPAPHFIFNATSLQTGELWQFRPRAMGGSVVGWTEPGDVRLAQAVAASSAFPPFLSPLYLTLSGAETRRWRNCNLESFVHATDPDLHTGRSLAPGSEASFRDEILLTDGGVRDNLGLVAVEQINRKRNDDARKELDVLVSDAGRSFGPEEKPYTNWLVQTYRVLQIATNEPDLLRIETLVRRAVTQEDERQIRALCPAGEDGHAWPRWKKDLCLKADASYWSSERIPPRHEGYAVQPAAMISREDIRSLGRIPTRLAETPLATQQRLVNWGYLSAHYGLPFINRLWQGETWRLNLCRLPYPDEGLTGNAEQTARLCVAIGGS